jgi:hypothetical protein
MTIKSFITKAGICLLLCTATTRVVAQEQTDKDKPKQPALNIGEGEGVAATAKATIQDINRDKREVTLKKEDGTTVTIKVPETVRNFDQMKVGDIVTAKYSQSVAVAVRKSDEPPSATGRESTERAAPGQEPAIKKSKTVEISATIEKIDRDKRELTLKGPEGKTRTVKVPEDMKKFNELKEGDEVVVAATESLAIDVSKPQE